MISPELKLSDDIRIPQLGLGTWNLGSKATPAIRYALESGYRHFDTADVYRTHTHFAEAIPRSGVAREDIFIVTKLWSHSMAGNTVEPAVERFLQELGTEYIDLLLIHWPSSNVPVEETIGAMEKVRNAGKIRSIGVSNFNVAKMQEALATGVAVVNNQIEYNLNRQPQDVLGFCREAGVTVTAYSPLERGSQAQEALAAELARKYSGTREQVLINWVMGKGMIAIPRSSNPKHIESNLRSLEWKMEEADIVKLDEAR